MKVFFLGLILGLALGLLLNIGRQVIWLTSWSEQEIKKVVAPESPDLMRKLSKEEIDKRKALDSG